MIDDELYDKLLNWKWYELLKMDGRKNINDFQEIIDCMEKHGEKDIYNKLLNRFSFYGHVEGVRCMIEHGANGFDKALLWSGGLVGDSYIEIRKILQEKICVN